jgi:hypothetical protein
MEHKVYQHLASAVCARRNCKEGATPHPWEDRWDEVVEKITGNYLPHGSGFDGEVTVDLDESNDSRLVIHTAFHPLNGDGYYEEWINGIEIVAKPSLQFGFTVNTRRGIFKDQSLKDLILEQFQLSLDEVIPEDEWKALVLSTKPVPI